MSPSNWLLIIVGGVYVGGIVLVIIVARWRRTTRWPFREEDRLLRGPGEHLRRRITEIDERLIFELMGGLVAILFAMECAVTLNTKLLHLESISFLVLVIATGVGTLGLALWRIVRLWQERANHFLGWFGERIVAEQLQSVTAAGWRIFHDVPFTDNGAKYNIDHVAVGPGGVFVIETKTRRKGNARPGFDDNKVYFDGRDLVWPWGEDNHGLEQAERNALRLTEMIKTEAAERVFVTPILALPGWWLEMKPMKSSRLCRVVNPKWLPSILAKERPLLTPKQIELISLRLDARCRDVED